MPACFNNLNDSGWEKRIQHGIRLIQMKTNRPPCPASGKQSSLFDGIPENASKEIWIFQDYERTLIIKNIRRIIKVMHKSMKFTKMNVLFIQK
jgi:hypothetical protein